MFKIFKTVRPLRSGKIALIINDFANYQGEFRVDKTIILLYVAVCPKKPNDFLDSNETDERLFPFFNYDELFGTALSALLEMGLAPHFLTDEVLAQMIEIVVRHKAGIHTPPQYSKASNGDEQTAGVSTQPRTANRQPIKEDLGWNQKNHWKGASSAMSPAASENISLSPRPVLKLFAATNWRRSRFPKRK